MKKTYKNPTLTVVNIQPAQFIANSIKVGAKYNGTATIESRRSRFSDFDEEEEE